MSDTETIIVERPETCSHGGKTFSMSYSAFPVFKMVSEDIILCKVAILLKPKVCYVSNL